MTAAQFSGRLDAVAGRVREAASRPRPAESTLTDADAATGERWEEGQVWAHMSEFVPYWIAEARLVLAGEPGAEATPFGRVKSDPARVAAIAERRGDPIDALAEVVLTDIAILRGFLDELGDSPAVWASVGHHSTLGDMTVEDIFEEFLIGHLEQHVDQLDGLAS